MADINKLAAAAHVSSRPISLNNITNEEDERQGDYDMVGVPQVVSAEDYYLQLEALETITLAIQSLSESHQLIINALLGINGEEAHNKYQLMKRLKVNMPTLNAMRNDANRALKRALEDIGYDPYLGDDRYE